MGGRLGSELYAYANGDPIDNIDPLGLWSLSLNLYDVYGGGLILTGTGLHFTSLTLRGGIGVGAGFSFDPRGKQPDPCAPSGSNSMRVFAEGSLSALFLEYGKGYNAGLTAWTDSNGVVHYHRYAGGEPEIGAGNGKGGWTLGFGIEGEGSAGGEWT